MKECTRLFGCISVRYKRGNRGQGKYLGPERIPEVNLHHPFSVTQLLFVFQLSVTKIRVRNIGFRKAQVKVYRNMFIPYKWIYPL